MWLAAEARALLDGAVLLERPALLWLVVPLALALLALCLRRGPWRIIVPTARARAERWRFAEPSWLLSLTLRTGALALVAVTLARPVGLIRENPAGGEGIDLVIALDASGSMNALDGRLDRTLVTRLDLAKAVVSEFVKERDGDRIGLVAFGQHAFTQCPLTADHRIVQTALERIEVGVAGDQTALGEAIGLATRRLDVPGAPKDAQRTIVLVTDGRHNAGSIPPETAAEIARLRRVRIHAVGIGGIGEVPFAQKGPGEPLRFEKVDLDRKTLEAVATITGGRYFHARRPEDLRAVTAAIDAIEAKPRAVDPRYRRASLAPLTLLAALGLLLTEAATAFGFLRRAP